MPAVAIIARDRSIAGLYAARLIAADAIAMMGLIDQIAYASMPAMMRYVSERRRRYCRERRKP